MSNASGTLSEKLLESFSTHAGKNAVNVNNRYYTFEQLHQMAEKIAQTLCRQSSETKTFIAIFGSRSIQTYAGIIGVLLSGNAYLPLNPAFPPNRLHKMLQSSNCNTLILCEECAENFRELAQITQNLTVICPDPGENIAKLRKSIKRHDFITPDNNWQNTYKPVMPENPAYIMFTSGSTGNPKGVIVSHKNVCSYLDYTLKRYRVSPDDRLSQMFDITFDLSVHDIFVSLLSGACLYVVPRAALMAPAKFIKKHNLTIWFSVPSVAMIMQKLRLLKPDSFPSLRISLFCGEAMPRRSAEAWQAAATNSVIENLYGPTEATIAITNYRWNQKTSPAECKNDILPIGRPFDGQAIKIMDEHGKPVISGKPGELYLCGTQITQGYLHAHEKTANSFVSVDTTNKKWYRTGDLATQNTNGCIFYLGRIDEQIQIRGYRVELQEIDKVLRKAAGNDLAIAVPQGLENGCAKSIYALVQGTQTKFLIEKITDYCQKHLPDYMVPSKIIFTEKIPMNANGKLSRKPLMQNDEK